MKVLVTGAAGLYGVHVVDLLVKRRDVSRVYALDNFGRGYMVSPAFLASEEFERKCRVMHRDYQELTAAELDDMGVDVIIHLAAYISVDESMVRPRDYILNNEVGGVALVQELLKTKTRPTLIVGSSAEVYGEPVTLPMDVDHPTNPKNVYGITKLALDWHCMLAHAWEGYPVIIVRNFNTFGPNYLPGRYAAVLPTFIEKALRNEAIVVHNDGEQTRDFLYVKDAARAYDLLLDGHRHLSGKVFNLGTGDQISVNELAEKVKEQTRSQSPIVHVPGRRSDIRALASDSSELSKAVGWRPQYSFDDGLAETIRWTAKVLPRACPGRRG